MDDRLTKGYGVLFYDISKPEEGLVILGTKKGRVGSVAGVLPYLYETISEAETMGKLKLSHNKHFRMAHVHFMELPEIKKEFTQEDLLERVQNLKNAVDSLVQDIKIYSLEKNNEEEDVDMQNVML